MSLRRLLAALGVGIVGGSALATVLGLLGWASPWLDAFNHVAPLWAVAALLGAALCLTTLTGPFRRPVIAAGAATIAVSILPVVNDAIQAEKPASAASRTLKLLTANLYWRSPAEGEIAMIRAAGADVVTLQEADTHNHVLKALEPLYPHQIACGPGCDTAILSKTPFVATGHASEIVSGHSAYLWATLTAPDGKPVTVATAHLFWPIMRDQADAEARVVQMSARLTSDPILAGDFNMTPWSFGLRRMDAGLRGMTRRTRNRLTWASHNPSLPALLPLDQIYAAPSWRTVALTRLPRAGSDHHPLLIELAR